MSLSIGIGVGLGERSGGSGGSSPSSLLTGLAFAYNLHETGTGTAADSLGVNNLSAINSPAGVSTAIGEARQFVAASSQAMSAPDNAALRLSAGAFTVCGWAIVNTANHSWIISKWNGSQTEWVISYFTGNGGGFGLDLSTGAGSGDTFVVTSTPVATGTPVFVAARYDLSNMYISINAGAENSNAFTAPAYSGTAPLELARGNGGNYFDGDLNRWFGWSRDIGTAGIAAVYNGGSGVDYPFVGIP